MMGMANRSKVIVRRGSKLQALCQDQNRELVTVVECICADGTTVSPVIIYKGAAHYYGWHPECTKDSEQETPDQFILAIPLKDIQLGGKRFGTPPA